MLKSDVAKMVDKRQWSSQSPLRQVRALPRDIVRKLERKGVDLICANRVGIAGGGFESDDNALLVIDRDGERALGPASKTALAGELLDIVAECLSARSAG